jgi:tyrosyl-tRNA synthetase
MTEGNIWIVKLLVLAGMAKSNGEARRLIQGGGVSFEGDIIKDADAELSAPLNGVLKVGKRRFVKVVA